VDLTIKELIKLFNQNFTLFVIFPSILLLGIYLSIQLRFIQISKLKLSFSYLIKKQADGKGNISHFEAISTVLAGNFGTGNISGMAIAIAAGGPGALVWMWITAFFGAIIQYASCVLSVKYREKVQGEEFAGGPMYYLKNGLGYKTLGLVFAFFTICGAFTCGNLAQVNSIMLPLTTYGFDPLLSGIVIALFVGFVTLGGIKRVAGFASIFVPIKATLYLGIAFIIIAMHWEKVLPAFQLMFGSAFHLESLTGGVAGYGVLKAIATGFDRGIFATDAGTGLVPILQSTAKTKNPVVDGLVTLVAPLLVMIVCTTTGLVLIVTGAWEQIQLQSTNMVSYAFEKGLGHVSGSYIVIISLVLFAYTTILAWGCCGEKAAGFIFGPKAGYWFRYLYVLSIPAGAFFPVDLVWLLADVSISLMLFSNLIGVAGLSREVIEESRKFFPSKSAKDYRHASTHSEM
jgi:alanine or glycine:cation symporter, AGCS family